MERPKLSLELLKNLFNQIEAQVAFAEKLREGVDLSNPENIRVFENFVVEMSKVYGLLNFLGKEATGLTKDINTVIRCAVVPLNDQDSEQFLDVKSFIKGLGGGNSGPIDN